MNYYFSITYKFNLFSLEMLFKSIAHILNVYSSAAQLIMIKAIEIQTYNIEC